MTMTIIDNMNKYELIGELTAEARGTIIDIGARDRKLKDYLKSDGLEYLSADMDPDAGHDITLNLENRVECDDGAFDYVVALDVLEHVDRIHDAFSELIRITGKKLFVSLPNMSCLSFRVHYLRHGKLSGKYELTPEPPGDRHRWLTGYDQGCTFINSIAQQAGCNVKQYDILKGYGRIHKLVSLLPLPQGLKTYTVLFEVAR